MRALHQIAGIALNLLPKLLRLILAPELELLDLALLLSSLLVEALVLRLELELTTELAVVQLLLAYRVGQHVDFANAGGSTRGRRLIQLRATRGMRNGGKRDQGALPGRSRRVIETHVKIHALLLSLQQIAIDPVLGAGLCRRQCAKTRPEECGEACR
jgi:hypothetical protein